MEGGSGCGEKAFRLIANQSAQMPRSLYVPNYSLIFLSFCYPTDELAKTASTFQFAGELDFGRRYNALYHLRLVHLNSECGPWDYQRRAGIRRHRMTFFQA